MRTLRRFRKCYIIEFENVTNKAVIFVVEGNFVSENNTFFKVLNK